MTDFPRAKSFSNQSLRWYRLFKNDQDILFYQCGVRNVFKFRCYITSLPTQSVGLDFKDFGDRSC